MMMFQCLALMCLFAGACSGAQDTEAGKTSPTTASTQKVADFAALDFSKPKTVEDLDAVPKVAGRFDCSDDGSIYALIDGYALNSGGSALLAIHSDGTVTNLPWRSIPGFTDLSRPMSVFVGNGRIYVLVRGSRKSATDNRILRYPLVLTFDNKGSLQRTVVLEQDLYPLVLGVFSSEKMLLLSEDRVNKRMALRVVGADGKPIRDLSLNDSDFVLKAAQMPAAALGTSRYSTLLLTSMSKFYPSGDNLLLVPLGTSGLPIVELDENRVLRSVVPHLPGNMVLEAFLSSNASSWKVHLGTYLESDKEVLDSQGKVNAFGTRPSLQITELSRADGSLLREIDMGGPGLRPACEIDGTFRFLTSNDQGRLQVVTARVR